MMSFFYWFVKLCFFARADSGIRLLDINILAEVHLGPARQPQEHPLYIHVLTLSRFQVILSHVCDLLDLWDTAAWALNPEK